MTLKSRLANAYMRFGGVEEVTIKRRHPTEADVTGVKALMRLRTLGQSTFQAATAGIDPNACIWDFWEATMGGAKLDNLDKFTQADGTEWTIQQVDYSNQTSRFRCLAVRSRV